MAGLVPRTGWSLQGRPPRRMRSMTTTVAPGTEHSAVNAMTAQHGFAGAFTWSQKLGTLLVPSPQ